MNITLLICVKNEKKYISHMLDSILVFKPEETQIIVVDDHSTDNTFSILQYYSSIHSNIEIYKNDGSGKVDALNKGAKYVRGEILKLVDGDDLLTKDCLENLTNYHKHFQLCTHDFILLSKDNDERKYFISKDYFELNTSHSLMQMKSIPKASWSFTKEIYKDLFPIPVTIPYEDIWISVFLKVNLKKYSHKHIDKELYYYRQHDQQTYGALMDFSVERIRWRAQRNAKAAASLVEVKRFYDFKRELKSALRIQTFLADRLLFPPLILFRQKLPFILKIIASRYFTIILQIVSKYKYKK